MRVKEAPTLFLFFSPGRFSSKLLMTVCLSSALLTGFGALHAQAPQSTVPVQRVQATTSQRRATARKTVKKPVAPSIDKEKAHRLNLEAIELQSTGKLEEAAAAYRKAISLNPASGASHNNLAVVLKDLNQLEEAEKEARIALRYKSDRADYHYNLGLILHLAEKLDEALAEFRAVLKKNPSDFESLYRLAEVLTRKGEYTEAEENIKMALLLQPGEPRFHKVLAEIYMQEKKYEEALYEFKRVVDLTPSGKVELSVQQRIDFLRQALNVR